MGAALPACLPTYLPGSHLVLVDDDDDDDAPRCPPSRRGKSIHDESFIQHRPLQYHGCTRGCMRGEGREGGRVRVPRLRLRLRLLWITLLGT